MGLRGGGDRDPSKRPQMAGIAEKYGDKIYVTTDNPRTEKPQDIIDQILTGFSDLSTVQSIVSREEAIERAISYAGFYLIIKNIIEVTRNDTEVVELMD